MDQHCYTKEIEVITRTMVAVYSITRTLVPTVLDTIHTPLLTQSSVCQTHAWGMSQKGNLWLPLCITSKNHFQLVKGGSLELRIRKQVSGAKCIDLYLHSIFHKMLSLLHSYEGKTQYTTHSSVSAYSSLHPKCRYNSETMRPHQPLLSMV